MKNANKKYKRYPEYKPSGLAWIGDAPSHWAYKRSGYIFCRRSRPVRESDGVITAFRDGQVTLRSNRRQEGFTNALKEIGYQGVRKGDLLIHAMDGFAGAIGVSDSEGKCSPVCSVCTANNMDEVCMPYYGMLLRFMATSGYVTSLAKGIRERSTEFRYNEFRTLKLPLPPLPEQRAIAAFLDRETGKIDRMVERQGRMIELLQEKRQAVISHAVTKGLDPDAPMKDSGVEWLGEIPEGWEVRKMKYICRVQTGGKDTVDAVEDGKYPFFVRSQNVERINTHTFNCEAVLTAGDGAGVGKVFHHYKGPFDFHQRVYMMNRFKKIYGRYFFFYLREQFAKVSLDGNAKSTVDSLRMPLLMDFPFTIPPLSEQEAIILFIDKQITKIDSLISKAKAAIELMKERRTALISAAVTGKIDVRDAIEYELGDTGGLMAAEGGDKYAADS